MAKPAKPPSQPTLQILKRRSIAPLNLVAGNRIRHETHDNVLQVLDLLDSHAMVANEAIIFETTFEGRRAIGTFVLAEP